MNTFRKPAIVTPAYWLANVDKVQDYLNTQVRRGNVNTIGATTHGRPVNVVEYFDAPAHDAALMIIGGIHGHEPGTVAAAMNLIHLMETGVDLDGQAHDQLLDTLKRVKLAINPMANPDGRAVCLDSFYGLGLETCVHYACGITRDGDHVPYDADSKEALYYFDPDDCLFIGGQFNGAGVAANRRTSLDAVDEMVEVGAMVRYFAANRFDALFDMHACGYNFAFQARSHEPPYWPIMRDWHARAEKRFAAKGYPLRALHGDGDPPPLQTFVTNAALYHHHAKLMSVVYEGRQGHLEKPFWPLTSEWQIIDAYLEAIGVFARLGVEGRYAAANRAVFGE
jgi:hypothetical protein